MSAEDVCRTAQNLARNCGYAVFPVGESKHPARPKAEGGDGYKDASIDPERIAWMWNRWPGPLIGIATGARSGIDVLDIDRKHAEAMEWWFSAAQRMSRRTRVYRTRSGGRHAYFRHANGVVNTTGKLAKSVDTRGDGGYAIHWFSAGCPCLSHDPPAPWPDWLLDALLRRTLSPAFQASTGDHADRAIDAILNKVTAAAEGSRNAVLFWGANRLRERVVLGQVSASDARHHLLVAAHGAGLDQKEAQATISSAWKNL